MSILRDFRKREIDTFPGLDSRTEPRKNIRAQKVENVHFELDHPRTRSGLAEFDTIDSVDDLSRSHGMGVPTNHYAFKHFIASDWERFVALAKDGSNNVYLYYETLAGATAGQTDVLVPSLNSTITNAITTIYGARVYSVFTKDDGSALSAQQGIVWNGAYTGTSIEVDTLFQAPWTGTINVGTVETNPAPVTEGVHKLALVFVTRNGHETAPKLLSSVTATGDVDITISFTPTTNWPDWVDAVKPVITTVQNQELYYFVPNTSLSVTAGTMTAVQFLFDMSDIELTQASEATDWFSLANSSTVGAVKFIDNYGDRLVYIVDNADQDTFGNASSVWFSDVADPQRIAADRNQRFLPNKRPMTGGAELNGVYYVFGPNWTYAFTETTDFPVTWFPAQEISGTVGIKYPGCVVKNSTNSMLWVAHTSGLYTFNGQQYNDLPASYRQPVEWARINWAAPSWCFKMIDDEVNEQVLFQVPLDDAVTPSHVLKWDYKRGFSRDHVRFSLDNYKDGEGPLVPVFELVQNPNTSLLEVWALDAESNAVYRTKNRTDDAATWFTDDGLSIESVYRSEALSPVGPAPLKHGGVHARITGAGNVNVTIYPYVGSLDLADSYRFKGAYTRDLDETQYGPYLFLLGWQSETAYFEVSNATNDSWWELGSITHYYNDWLAQR